MSFDQKEYLKKYYLQNKERMKQRARLRYAAMSTEIKEQHKEYLAKPSAKVKNKNAKRKWEQQNKQKVNAKAAVRRAILSGILSRQPCIICGAGNAQAHHPDYTQQLFITWLCSKHHSEVHKTQRNLYV